MSSASRLRSRRLTHRHRYRPSATEAGQALASGASLEAAEEPRRNGQTTQQLSDTSQLTPSHCFFSSSNSVCLGEFGEIGLQEGHGELSCTLGYIDGNYCQEIKCSAERLWTLITYSARSWRDCIIFGADLLGTISEQCRLCVSLLVET